MAVNHKHLKFILNSTSQDHTFLCTFSVYFFIGFFRTTLKLDGKGVILQESEVHIFLKFYVLAYLHALCLGLRDLGMNSGSNLRS